MEVRGVKGRVRKLGRGVKGRAREVKGIERGVEG